MRFDGTKAYVATDDLKIAVNAAITLERPLLVKGEPGTGKTVLATKLQKPSRTAHRMAHQIRQSAAVFTNTTRSHACATASGDRRVHHNYIKRGKLWDAFVADERPCC
jgi:broad-specificity NMP kinase